MSLWELQIWLLVTDVSGPPMPTTFKGQAVQPISRHVSVNTAWNIVRLCVDMCSAETKSNKSNILGSLVRKVFHTTFRLTSVVFRLRRHDIFLGHVVSSKSRFRKIQPFLTWRHEIC
jgi:hypothetical protein